VRDEPRVDLWHFRLDVPEEELELSRALLSEDEVARSSRFVRPRDRDRFAVARGRLRMILGAELGVRAASVAFRYGLRGKPDLAAPFDRGGLRFSLSHSADRALVAITRHRSIGCDLEAVRDVRSGQDLARRIFAPQEFGVLEGLEGEAWRRAFFRCWTLKEAWLKARGDGLTFPTRRFAVAIAPGEPARLLRVDGEPDAASRWSLREARAPEGFLAAIAVEGPVGRLLDRSA
jgi:4'-phosphopantetheinyl transferase